MTLNELTEKYKVSESSVLNNFKRTQASILKKHNVKIIKVGRGISASYEEEYESDCRALTIYDEMREDIQMNEDIFSHCVNWEFLVFLAIVVTPMRVFRGTKEDFLDYIQVNKSINNLEALSAALDKLVEMKYINVVWDKTKFTAILYEQVEEKMSIQLNMIKKCRAIAEEHHKRSWVPLLKTWVGIEIVSKNQPFTIAELCDITGLSKYQITDCTKLLQQDEVIRKSRAYVEYTRCVGSYVDINGIAYQD